jgi:hypothetical protein
LTEDAAQAAFLVLAQKAKAVRGEVGPFLHGVAVLAAQLAKQGRMKMEKGERKAAEALGGRGQEAESDGYRDLRPHLDEAIARLSKKQRAAILASLSLALAVLPAGLGSLSGQEPATNAPTREPGQETGGEKAGGKALRMPVHAHYHRDTLPEITSGLHFLSGIHFAFPAVAGLDRTYTLDPQGLSVQAVIAALSAQGGLVFDLAHEGRAIAFWKRKNEEWPRLIAAATSKQKDDRCYAALLLGRSGAKEALALLGGLLADGEGSVAQQALWAILDNFPPLLLETLPKETRDSLAQEVKRRLESGQEGGRIRSRGRI